MSMLLTQPAMEAMQAHDGNNQTGPIEMTDGKAYLRYDTIRWVVLIVTQNVKPS